jgi:hypothetical protein
LFVAIFYRIVSSKNLHSLFTWPGLKTAVAISYQRNPPRDLFAATHFLDRRPPDEELDLEPLELRPLLLLLPLE